MPIKKSVRSCASAVCCDFRVESIVTVDERGQMVLPKELRKSAGIKPGDKLAAVAISDAKGVCCISLIKVDDLVGMVKNRLGPLLKDALGLGK